MFYIIYPLIFVGSVYSWKFIKRYKEWKKSEYNKLYSVVTGVVISMIINFFTSTNEDIFEIFGLKLNFNDCFYTIVANTLLFLGPLYQEYKDNTLKSTFSVKIHQFDDRKKYIYAPLLEELTFRVALRSISIFWSALYFSISHAHIFYRLYRRTNNFKKSLLRVVFLLSYTFIFGLYSGQIYQVTQSLPCVFFLHSFCNIIQFPKIQLIPNREKSEIIISIRFIYVSIDFIHSWSYFIFYIYMNLYLKEIRELLFAGKLQKIILGNSTADMDSCVGSILLSYSYEEKIAPIINFKKKDFKSHFEITQLFDPLIFIDEININDYQIILYDHNDFNHPNVIGCIDHHEDKGYNFPFKQIEKVGSATTLVGEILIKQDRINQEIASLIIKTILLDTFNFDIKQKGIRWVEKDKQVFDYCLKYHPIDTNEEYQKLSDLKYNVDLNLSLTLEEIIHKDYKQFRYNKHEVGYAVIFLSSQIFQQKYSLEQLALFAEERNLASLFTIFLLQNGNQVQREFIVFGKYQNIVADAIKHLNIKEQQTGINYRSFIDVENIYSRKILEPLIQQQFSQLK